MQKPIYIRLATPVVLIGILLTTLFFVRPQYNKVRKARQTLASERQKIEKLKAKAQALEALNEAELLAKTEVALKALPAKKDVMQTIFIMNRLAEETGVIIEKFSVSPGEISEEESAGATTPQDKLSFGLELLGNDEGFRAFLERLAEFIPLTDVKKASLGLAGDVGTAEFAWEFYFSPLPKVIGKPETPLPKLTAEEEEVFDRISTLPYYVSEKVLTPVPSGRENPFAF